MLYVSVNKLVKQNGLIGEINEPIHKKLLAKNLTHDDKSNHWLSNLWPGLGKSFVGTSEKI